MDGKTTTQASPYCSFIIPAYNCAGSIERCVASINLQFTDSMHSGEKTDIRPGGDRKAGIAGGVFD